MNVLIISLDGVKYERNGGCPYDGITICLASLSSMLIDNQKRLKYCRTEDYDGCAIFLEKILRKITNEAPFRPRVT